ncbi:MAG TPA: ABC transporter permease [Gaiellaceae bacterium]|nr:ABC transporter permease [Gaiellaceae bacterium]
MTWAGLVWRNLMRRAVRTGLTSAGVAIGVALIVALLSIAAGVRATAGDLIHVGRSDFGVFQSGASDLTKSLLPESLDARLRATPGISDVAAIFLRVSRVQGRDSFLVFGLRPDEFAYRRFVVVAGRRATGNEAMLGDEAAKSLHLGPGDRLHVENRTFRIAGLYHSGNHFEDIGATLPLAAVQQLSQRPGEVTTFGITIRLGSRPGDVAKEVERRFPGVTAVTEPGQVVKVDTSSRLIIDAGWIFSLLALIVGGIGVTNTMAMSVFERVHEIGIMRAVGWPGRRIAALILSEAVGIGLLALAAGLAAGYGAAVLFVDHGNLSELASPDFTPEVFAWGLAFALGVAVIGALYPAWRAVRLTPIEALRRE